MIMPLMLSALVTKAVAAGSTHRLFVEFNGICAFVQKKTDPQHWMVVFPNLAGVHKVNPDPGMGHPHHAYLKIWDKSTVAPTSDMRQMGCSNPNDTILCNLIGENIVIDASIKDVSTSPNFGTDVVSIKGVSGESALEGFSNPASPRILSRAYVNQGTLTAIVDPLVRWDLGDGNGPRQVARSVIWEVQPDAGSSISVYGQDSSCDPKDIKCKTKWHLDVDLSSSTSTVISIAQTDDVDATLPYYYDSAPPSGPDFDFLLHYALVKGWTVDTTGVATATCNGDTANCHYPISPVAAVPATHWCTTRGRKTNCFVVQFPSQ